jgi:hypothetical protein
MCYFLDGETRAVAAIAAIVAPIFSCAGARMGACIGKDEAIRYCHGAPALLAHTALVVGILYTLSAYFAMEILSS